MLFEVLRLNLVTTSEVEIRVIMCDPRFLLRRYTRMYHTLHALDYLETIPTFRSRNAPIQKRPTVLIHTGMLQKRDIPLCFSACQNIKQQKPNRRTPGFSKLWCQSCGLQIAEIFRLKQALTTWLQAYGAKLERPGCWERALCFD